MDDTSPVRAFRLEQGWTYERFARKCKVTVAAIKKAEQALYTSIPPKILITMKKTDEFFDWEYLYFQYILERRRETFLQIAPAPTPRITDRSPWQDWIGRAGFESHISACSAFCVHPYSINNWSSGNYRNMPKQLVEAFQQAGFKQDFIDDFAECQKEWRLAKLRSRNALLGS